MEAWIHLTRFCGCNYRQPIVRLGMERRGGADVQSGSEVAGLTAAGAAESGRRMDSKATTPLYFHRTDGGAEYLCLRHVDGWDGEGDVRSALVRLDGGPELLLANTALITAGSVLLAACKQLRAALDCPRGAALTLRPGHATLACEVLDNAIAQAEGRDCGIDDPAVRAVVAEGIRRDVEKGKP